MVAGGSKITFVPRGIDALIGTDTQISDYSSRIISTLESSVAAQLRSS